VHTSCDSRTAIVFVSEGSERVKTATLSFKLNYAQRRAAEPVSVPGRVRGNRVGADSGDGTRV
jgi:hypothetical protein